MLIALPGTNDTWVDPSAVLAIHRESGEYDIWTVIVTKGGPVRVKARLEHVLSALDGYVNRKDTADAPF